jgi:hypothetical protein
MKKLSKWQSKQYKIPKSPGEKFQENEKRKLIRLIGESKTKRFMKKFILNSTYGSMGQRHVIYDYESMVVNYYPRHDPLLRKSIFELEEMLLERM